MTEQPRRTYSEKLKDPRWQRRRLEVLQRDNWKCQMCSSTTDTLHVHHRYYHGSEPWQAPDDALVTLCEFCHEQEGGSRNVAESKLLRALRAKLFALEVEGLAMIIDDMPTAVLEAFVFGAIRGGPPAPEFQRRQTDVFITWLEKRKPPE